MENDSNKPLYKKAVISLITTLIFCLSLLATGFNRTQPSQNENNKVSDEVQSSAIEDWTAQQNYAWEWFKYHAKQRTDMFNYFLIATGLLITGYVSLRKDSHLVLSGLTAVVGFFASVGFFLLDCRNKQLVDNAAKVLAVIEKTKLFTDHRFEGLGLCQGQADKSRIWFRHKTVFRGSQVLIALMWLGFLGASIHFWSIVHRETNHPKVPAYANMRSPTVAPKGSNPNKVKVP